MAQLFNFSSRRSFLTALAGAFPSAALAASADYASVDYQSMKTRPYAVGIASFYGAGVDGKHTANGDVFRASDYSAAHRELPFGTMLRVTNLDNGRSVVVKVNDRGPAANGRIIDLSQRAAIDLDMCRAGIARVSLTVIGKVGEPLYS